MLVIQRGLRHLRLWQHSGQGVGPDFAL